MLWVKKNGKIYLKNSLKLIITKPVPTADRLSLFWPKKNWRNSSTGGSRLNYTAKFQKPKSKQAPNSKNQIRSCNVILNSWPPAGRNAGIRETTGLLSTFRIRPICWLKCKQKKLPIAIPDPRLHGDDIVDDYVSVSTHTVTIYLNGDKQIKS